MWVQQPSAENYARFRNERNANYEIWIAGSIELALVVSGVLKRCPRGWATIPYIREPEGHAGCADHRGPKLVGGLAAGAMIAQNIAHYRMIAKLGEGGWRSVPRHRY